MAVKLYSFKIIYQINVKNPPLQIIYCMNNKRGELIKIFIIIKKKLII